MGRSTGLEPATSGTTNRRSNQLSYDRHKPFLAPRITQQYGLGKGRLGFFERKPTETLVELGNAAARIELAGAASPGWVRCRINIQHQRIPLFAPSGAGFKGAAIGHLDGDPMIIGVAFGFHVVLLSLWPVPTGLKWRCAYSWLSNKIKQPLLILRTADRRSSQ